MITEKSRSVDRLHEDPAMRGEAGKLVTSVPLSCQAETLPVRKAVTKSVLLIDLAKVNRDFGAAYAKDQKNTARIVFEHASAVNGRTPHSGIRTPLLVREDRQLVPANTSRIPTPATHRTTSCRPHKPSLRHPDLASRVPERDVGPAAPAARSVMRPVPRAWPAGA